MDVPLAYSQDLRLEETWLKPALNASLKLRTPLLWVQMKPKTSMGKQEEDNSDAKGTENQKRRPIKSCTTKTCCSPQHWATRRPSRASSTCPCTCAKQPVGRVKVFSRTDTNSSAGRSIWVLAAYRETARRVVETPRVHGVAESRSW